MKSEAQQTRQQQQQQERSASADDKNVMPSMVVRQQRIQMLSSSAMNSQGASGNTTRASTNLPPRRGPADATSLSTTAIPAATTSATTASLIKAAREQLNGHPNQAQQQLEFDQDGLVLPKRVLHHHPASSMAQPIIRDLNRELKFNQVRGKNVLDQKSELKKALEKLEVSKRKKEAEQERLNRRSSLELRLEERAERIAKETSSASTGSLTTNTTTSTTTVAAAAKTTTTTTNNNNNNNSSIPMSSNTCNQNPLGTFSIKSMTR